MQLGSAAPPPRAHVVAAQDRAVPTALQRRVVADNPDVDAVEIDADHSPFLSRPAELAVTLERFAAG